MKTTKRLVLIALAIVMLATCTAQVFADTIIDYVLYTDICTYFDGIMIDSYNINGYTAVIVENLSYYCFDVTWNEQDRTLNVKLNPAKEITGIPFAFGVADKSRVGERLQPVYATDIKTYLDGQEIKSYNIGGKTIIYVDDLAGRYAENYTYNDTSRILRVDFLAPDSNGVPAAPAAASPIYYIKNPVSVNDKVDKSSIKANIGHYSYEGKDEGEKNIFDGDPETKWCTNYKEFGDGKNEIIVEWAMKEPVQVESYVITTANDTESYPGRNPRTWTLEAKKKKNEKWKVISAGKNVVLPEGNLTDSWYFKVDDPGDYTYYRLVITDNLEQIDIYQFSELKLYTYERIPMYSHHDLNSAGQLIDYLTMYGDVNSSTPRVTICLDDGSEVDMGFDEDFYSFFIDVTFSLKSELFTVSVCFSTTSNLSYINFIHLTDGKEDDIIHSLGFINFFRGYDHYEGDYFETGLDVDIDDSEGSGFFRELAAQYDAELEPFVELMTKWGEYANYVMDLIDPGASIADLGFVKFGK